jgi:aldehyde dehydrogenase (NAD+)
MATQPNEAKAQFETISGGRSRYVGFDGQYINGAWRAGRRGQTLEDSNPYTGETVAKISLCDPSDVEEAYLSASKAQASWAARLPAERAAVMSRAADIIETRRAEILDWLIRESGSTRIKAMVEWQFLQAITLESASFPHRVAGRLLPIDEPGKESRAYRQPVGVIGVISPWNFPIYLSQRSVAPALALGNSVVLKPSSDTPVCGGLLLARIFEEAGLPPGLLNVVIGKSDEISNTLVGHRIPSLISFTGSTGVGQEVARLAVTGMKLKRLALELGGNTPAVVLDDADLDQAVRGTIFGRFLHQGQICMSSNRIIVDANLYDQFVDRFIAAAKNLKYGNPSDPDTVIGPVINRSQLQKMMDYMHVSREGGARQLLGGEPKGLVLPPHVFVDVKNDMHIARNETFGPIAPIIKVNGEREALEVANDTCFGLSSAVFTRDENRGLRFALAVQAGMTHINGSSVDDTPTGPFGGEKNSGLGRFGGEWIIEEFTTSHWITVQHEPGHYPF